MSIGLLAVLDDITALVKASIVSLDDIPAQITKTSGKVSGIVIDDAAVTPKYVVGLDPARELIIIGHIARQSLINKILLLSPFILFLDWAAPWALTPLLMIGGAYLCFEGYEKVHSLLQPHEAHDSQESLDTITPEELEKIRIKSAVTTDFILSTEIVAITYATVSNQPLLNQVVILLTVGLLITIAVYGFVALIVKIDDIGLYLATHHKSQWVQKLGKELIYRVQDFLRILGYVGSLAMLWVGAEIIVHGIPPIHHLLLDVEHLLSHLPLMGWLVKVALLALSGLVVGCLIGFFIEFVLNRVPQHFPKLFSKSLSKSQA